MGTGLGPVFNSNACVNCHDIPISGGGAPAFVTRIGAIIDGKFDPLTKFGGSVLQANGITGDTLTHRFQAEAPPPEATIVITRRSPALFGLGLVEATPDSTFADLVRQGELRGDGTAGRVNMVDNVVTGTQSGGKFGWKAQIATLLECHVPTLQTGSNSSAAFDRVTYHPYSDFLLHDMGSLGDGIEQGSATGREMRTAPLWGVRFGNNKFLHDGRARTLEDAILKHDGQGLAARNRFQKLSQANRTKLVEFLRRL